VFVCIIILGWTSLIFGMPFCSVLIFFVFFSSFFLSLVLLFLPSRISSRSILCIYVLVLCLHTNKNKDIYILLADNHRDFKFRMLVEHSKSRPIDDKPSLKRTWLLHVI